MYAHTLGAQHSVHHPPVSSFVETIQPDNYDRIVVALLGDSQAASQRLLDQGAPAHKVVTFFAEKNANASMMGERE